MTLFTRFDALCTVGDHVVLTFHPIASVLSIMCCSFWRKNIENQGCMKLFLPPFHCVSEFFLNYRFGPFFNETFLKSQPIWRPELIVCIILPHEFIFFIMSSHFLFVIYYSLYFLPLALCWRLTLFTIILFLISGNEN